MEGRRISLAMTLSVSLLLLACACHAQLTTNYYQHSCPSALSSIRKEVKKAVKSEPRMAASLIRLHFHDCFVQGCEGSLLLDNSSKIDSEKNALPNLNSVRGFELIDTIKARLERECPAIVSCADILAVAARDASKYAKGPTWNVKVGRRDGTTASSAVAAVNLPAFTDSLQKLTELFNSKGLNKRDLVALSGAHTIGRARCVTFRDRIYNASSDLIDPGFASNLQRNCPRTSPDGNLNLANLDLVTPDTFDNSYFKILLQKKGLLASDQVLFSGDATFDAIVKDYSKNTKNFFRDFGEAMIKMGDNGVLTGHAGQIRLNCRVPN